MAARSCSTRTATVWSDEPSWAPQAEWTERDRDKRTRAMAERILNKQQHLTETLRAPRVVVRAIRQAPGEIEHISYYMMKAPHEVKARVRNEKSFPPYCFKRSEARPDFIVRIVEILSQLPFNEAVRGVGADATAIVAKWRRELNAWNAQQRGGPGTRIGRDFDAAKL